MLLISLYAKLSVKTLIIRGRRHYQDGLLHRGQDHGVEDCTRTTKMSCLGSSLLPWLGHCGCGPGEGDDVSLWSREVFFCFFSKLSSTFLMDLPEPDSALSILISRSDSTSFISGRSLHLSAECSNILMASLEADFDIPDLKTIKPVWSCATT